MTDIECRDYGCGGSAPRHVQTIGKLSRAPRRPWFERHDLYWEPELYQFQPVWKAHGRYASRRKVNLRGEEVADLVWEPQFQPLGSRLLRHSEHVKGVVAALAAFHHMTSGQLAAHLGYPPSKLSRVLLPMYRAGLVERAVYLRQAWQPKSDTVYRLRAGEQLGRWLEELDDADFLAVALGSPVTREAHFVRHNLLVADLVLRLEEVAADPIQAVFGERLSGSDRLFPGQSAGRAVYGDACVVRGDGLRIVIELVRRQRDREVEDKMVAWGRLLSRSSLSEQGTVVLFLNASEQERAHLDRATALRRCFARALSRERLGTGETGCQYARSSLYVASWRDWAPAPWQLSTDFAQMVVCFSTDGKDWRRGALLPGNLGNVLQFTPAEPGRWDKPGRVALDPVAAAGTSASHHPRFYGLPPWLHQPITGTSPVPG